MNALSSVFLLSPYGVSEECAQMVIDDTATPFSIRSVTTSGEVYTFSCWIKSSAAASMTIVDTTVSVGTEWSKHELTFTANATSLDILFPNTGTYWIYHTQLELGNIATDWSPSPEDIKEEMYHEVDKVQSELSETTTVINTALLDINDIKGAISALVAGENGETLLTQTADGWVFSMSDILSSINSTTSKVQSDLNDANTTIDTLKDNVEKLGEYEEYIKFITVIDPDTGNEQPAIVLGETDSKFKVQITNTMIEFLSEDTDTPPVYISKQSLYITKAVVSEELQQGGFVWRVESDDSYSLIWKGV